MDQLPQLRTRIPGPKSRTLARQLRRVESRNVTFVSQHWPIFWQRAAGANVWDVDGNRYLDLSAGFGVANIGHGPPFARPRNSCTPSATCIPTNSK